MPVALQFTKSIIRGKKSLEMKNLFSKSTSEFDFQKFFNLILTEQRAQRVDLARLDKLIRNLIDNSIHFDDSKQEEEVYNGDSGSRD